jgi:hypothetical protein
MDRPQTCRIRKPTKVLITLAGGVVVIMLGTVAIVNGFWADNFQRVSHKIRRLTQTASISAGSSYKELDEKSTSSLARKGLNAQKPEKVQPKGLGKQATPAAKKNEDIGKAAKIPSSLRGSSEPGQPPASSLGSSGSGRIASIPLPNGFGRMEFEDEISPKVEKKLPKPPSAKFEIKPGPPGEAKPLAQIPKKEVGEPHETVSAGQPGIATLSSPRSAAPAQVASGSKLVIQDGENLTRIVNWNYSENQKLGMAAVILANPEIVSEDTIYPGQTLFLPEINFTNQTIRLKNNLLYAIYGIYRSPESLRVDTTWLAKKKIRFVVRNIKDSRGNAVHRVFLGGYATEEELEKAFEDVEPKTR